MGSTIEILRGAANTLLAQGCMREGTTALAITGWTMNTLHTKIAQAVAILAVKLTQERMERTALLQQIRAQDMQIAGLVEQIAAHSMQMARYNNQLPQLAMTKNLGILGIGLAIAIPAAQFAYNYFFPTQVSTIDSAKADDLLSELAFTRQLNNKLAIYANGNATLAQKSIQLNNEFRKNWHACLNNIENITKKI